MLIIFGYVGALLTGVTLGLIGGGGSILIVPVLVYLFSIAPDLATAYSLFVVGLASLVGAWRYYKADLIDMKTAVVFAIPALVGVYSTRRYMIPALPEMIFESSFVTITKDTLIMGVFAIIMLAASLAMIRKKRSAEQPEQESQISYNYKWIFVEGLIVGAITGFVGAGGGFLIIPALVLLAKLPIRMAIGTSLSIIAVKSLIGFLGDLGSAAAIDWPFLGYVSVTAISGIFVGTYLGKFIPGKKLEPAFGWFVLVMGTYILFKQVVR